MSGYRNQGFMDGFLRGYGFVDDLRQRDKDNKFRQERAAAEDARWEKTYGLSLKADNRAQTSADQQTEIFNQQKSGWLSPEQNAELAKLGYQDKVGEYGLGAKRRASEEAGLLSPEEAALSKKYGLQGLELGLQKDREAIATSRHARAKPTLPDGQRDYLFYASLSPEQRAVYDQMKGRGGNGLSVTLPDGTVVQQGGAPMKLTEQQSKDLVYFTRGQAALQNLTGVANQLADPVQSTMGAIPFAGNAMVSPDFQVARQAGLEYLASILRKDTGAAVTKSEEQLYGRIFLPQPFDSPAVLDQKAEARETALEAIRAGLGTAQALAKAGVSTSKNGLQGTSAAGGQSTPTSNGKSIVKRGTAPDGRRVVKYSDGTMGYE